MPLSWKTASEDQPAALVPQVLPWVVMAGEPYYSWLFGDAERATQVLSIWMVRPSSEVSVGRAQLLLCDNEIGGGFIALNGSDLKKARKADTIALLTIAPSIDRQALMSRLAAGKEIFSPVDDDEYYLSKIGVNAQFRRMGYGQILLERYIYEGRSRGYSRFRLDVHADNAEATRLYQRAGFQMSHTPSTDSPLKYYGMTLTA
jgi:predicted GNAT family N-acyltransferase